MIEKKELVTKRHYEVQDESFVFSTWLKGLRYGNDWFGRIEQESYFKNYHAVVEKILKKSSTRVNVACLKDDPDIILGYCVFEPLNESEHIVHWIYVKPVWRGIGIAKDLLPIEIKKVTHLTGVGYKLLDKNTTFDPFAI